MGLIIDEPSEAKIKESFQSLKNPVKLIVFTQEFECQYCRENRALAEELVKLSPLLSLEVYNFVTDKEKVQQYEIEMVPAIVVVGKKDYGIRFYGIPGGYEFTSLIETIKMISSGDSGLTDKVKESVRKITKPINFKVFVTLTCPYCPPAVINAHRFAFENNLIKSNMIEAGEFVHLSNRYNVYAVPKTVINDTVQFEGAMSEDQFLAEVLRA
jgi:glutaredoxin-like protein